MKWFILPHIKHPEKHNEFEAYFNKNWSYSVQISLKNFLSTALCRFPRPKILAFGILKQERMEFKQTISKLKEKLTDSDFIIRSLHLQLKHLRANQNQNEEETNELIDRAISEYQSDSIDIYAAKKQTTEARRHKRSYTTMSAKDAAALKINEKYFRSQTSPSPQIEATKEKQSVLLKGLIKCMRPSLHTLSQKQQKNRRALTESSQKNNSRE